MGIKPDAWIIRMARERGMIDPFESSSPSGLISYGVSSYGYDFRIDRSFEICLRGRDGRLDPKQVSSDLFECFTGDYCWVDPGTFVLGQSVEYFRIPRNILSLCCGKSTYARCGLLVNVTPLEPEWEGHLTVSLTNTGPAPVKVYAGEGIAQLIFLESSEVCRTSYKDRKGKYMGQRGIVHARVKGKEMS